MTRALSHISAGNNFAHVIIEPVYYTVRYASMRMRLSLVSYCSVCSADKTNGMQDFDVDFSEVRTSGESREVAQWIVLER